MLLAAQKPHVVFFMADDTGWSNVGWHNEQMKTPHADALVKEGVELDRHYAFLCAQSSPNLLIQAPAPIRRLTVRISLQVLQPEPLILHDGPTAVRAPVPRSMSSPSHLEPPPHVQQVNAHVHGSTCSK